MMRSRISKSHFDLLICCCAVLARSRLSDLHSRKLDLKDRPEPTPQHGMVVGYKHLERRIHFDMFSRILSYECKHSHRINPRCDDQGPDLLQYVLRLLWSWRLQQSPKAENLVKNDSPPRPPACHVCPIRLRGNAFSEEFHFRVSFPDRPDWVKAVKKTSEEGTGYWIAEKSDGTMAFNISAMSGAATEEYFRGERSGMGKGARCAYHEENLIAGPQDFRAGHPRGHWQLQKRRKKRSSSPTTS